MSNGVVRFARKWVMLEPMVFLYMLSYMKKFSRQHVFMQKIAIDSFNVSFKDIRDNATFNKVQEETSTFIGTVNVVETVLAVCLMIVCGPWSDRHGRKYPLLLTLFGGMLSNIAYACIYYVDHHYNVSLSLDIYLLPSVLIGASGGDCNVFLMMFSYVGDLSVIDPSTRFTRFVTAEAFLFCGVVCGSLAGSYFSSWFGDFFIFNFCSGCTAAAFIYVLVRIENINPLEIGDKANIEKYENESIASVIKKIFLIPFKKREGYLRSTALLLWLAFLLSEIGFPIEETIMYLYTNKKFGWNESTQLIFNSLGTFSQVIGQFVVLPFLLRVVGMDKLLVGCLAGINRLASYVILAFITKEFWIYIVMGVNCLGGTVAIIVRATLASVVPADELGTYFTFLGITDTILPSVFSPMASIIYNTTLQWFPGFVWLVAAAFMGMLVVNFGLLFGLRKWSGRQNNYKQMEENSATSLD